MLGFVALRKTAAEGLEGVAGIEAGHPWRDHIVGGEAEGAQPTDFDPEQLAAGIKDELEHTNDPNIAAEIAMDHLITDPDYYKKMRLIEGEESEAKVAAAKQAGVLLARHFAKEAGLLGGIGKALGKIGPAASGGSIMPAMSAARTGWRVPAMASKGTVVRAPSKALMANSIPTTATKVGPVGSVAPAAQAAQGAKKIGLGRVGLLGAAGLGAYGLMKAVPWAVQAAREESSMPMAAGGGWSPTPYGYGYSPWGNAAPNMGAL